MKAGLKNAASARTAWSQLKKVIDKAKDTTGGMLSTQPFAGLLSLFTTMLTNAPCIADESVAKSIETPEASPAKGKKRKGAAASAGEMDGDDEEALSVSPAKTPFKRGGKTPKQEPAVKGDDEEDTMKEEASDS